MNRKILENGSVRVVFCLIAFLPRAVFSQTDSFEILLKDATHVFHAKVVSAMLIKGDRGGSGTSCGVEYQARVIEDFFGRRAQGVSVAFAGSGSLKVGSEYLIVLGPPSEGVSSGRCAEFVHDPPVLKAQFLVVKGSASAKTHPRDERIGVIEDMAAPFPNSIEVQQRSYIDCGSADFSDEENCMTFKTESVFLWSDLSSYLRALDLSEYDCG